MNRPDDDPALAAAMEAKIADIDRDIENKQMAALTGRSVDLKNAERGKPSRLNRSIGIMGAATAAAAIAAAEPLALNNNPLTRGMLDLLGPDKSNPPPDILDHTHPLAKFVKVRFDGEVRPDDVLSYNVTEGRITCGRYITISGERRWKKERGRILSYDKIGRVEPFWR